MKSKILKSTGVSRRTVLKGMGLAGGALALGGAPGLSLASSGQYGGVLRLGVVRGLGTINPIMHISGADWIATKWMYNNLTKLDHKRQVLPELAESWEGKDNASIWIFKLRKGVKFHIGRELVADDVVATFQKAIDPDTSAPYARELGPIAKIEALDKYTVKFTLSMPFADFPAIMTVPPARIVAREGLENFDSLATKEFGSGPFKLSELVTGDHMVVERFGDYFKKGQPYLDGAIEKVFPEASTEVNALAQGEIDVIWEVPPELYSKVATTKGVDGLEVASGTFSNVILPSDKAPFNDNRVRQALKLTVDRNMMMAAILSNHGEIMPDHPISTAYRFHSSLPLRERNIAKAKSLLKEAGFGSGLSFKLFVASSPPLREKIAIILKEMARPAGIDVQVEVVGYDRYLSQIWNKGVPYVGFYGTRPTADAILMKLYTKEFGIDEGRWSASHPDQVKLLTEARKIIDFNKRKALYAEFLKASRDAGPFMIPFVRSELSAKRDYVKEYKLNPSSSNVDLEAVWMTKEAGKKKS